MPPSDRVVSPGVIVELDDEIHRLERLITPLQDQLERVQEFKRWWIEKHPATAGAPQTLPVRRTHPRDAPSNEDGGGPNLREALRKVLEDGSRLTVSEARLRAERLGWTTESKHPNTRVRNTFKTMMGRGEIERDKDDYFRPDVASSNGSQVAREEVIEN